MSQLSFLFFFDLSVFKQVRVTFDNKIVSQKLFFLPCRRKENKPKKKKKDLTQQFLFLPFFPGKQGN